MAQEEIDRLLKENARLKSELELKEQDNINLRKVLKAFDQVSLFAQKQVLKTEKMVEAFEINEELSRREKMELHETINAYERIMHLTDDEKKELNKMIDSYEKTLEIAATEKKQLLNIISAFEISSDISSAEKQSIEENIKKKLNVLGKAIRELSSIYALISDNSQKSIEETLKRYEQKQK